MHCLLHLCNKGRLRGTRRCDAEARYATLQVDGHAQLLQEVHAENSVEWAATRFGDCGQVNRWQLDAAQTVATQPELADRNFESLQCGGFIPRCDVDFFRPRARECLLVEYRCGSGINQEALVGLVYLKNRNRQSIAALQRDLGAIGGRLCFGVPGSEQDDPTREQANE